LVIFGIALRRLVGVVSGMAQGCAAFLTGLGVGPAHKTALVTLNAIHN
jgi:hypothetical protein